MKMFNRTNRNAVNHSRFVVFKMSASVISMIFFGGCWGAGGVGFDALSFDADALSFDALSIDADALSFDALSFDADALSFDDVFVSGLF